MPLQIAPIGSHPEGEMFLTNTTAEQAVIQRSLPVDTLGHRLHVEWDPQASVTPLGQLVFFAQFLSVSGLYADWTGKCPLKYESPNAPAVVDVLGTWVLASLGGASRYAHVTALR